jgi:hypothetical protein
MNPYQVTHRLGCSTVNGAEFNSRPFSADSPVAQQSIQPDRASVLERILTQ